MADHFEDFTRLRRRRQVPSTTAPRVFRANAKDASQILVAGCLDLIVTSPPYWQKRNYGTPEQLGWERTPEAYVSDLADIVASWGELLKPSGSIFVNLGDSVRGGVIIPITTLFEVEMTRRGWHFISRIIWAKRSGLPTPHNRLVSRYEKIFQLAPQKRTFIDTYAYAQAFDLSDGDVWHIKHSPNKSQHVAPFPAELPRRALLLACPERVCQTCGKPLKRTTERGLELNPNRPQSRRALELWKASGLTDRHLKAIRATGIGDAGKSLAFQTGSKSNSQEVQRLAKEAKAVLNGYFREFTFALPEHKGFAPCEACQSEAHCPGVVMDPFMGTGTTLRAAQALGRRSIGIDIDPSHYTAK